MAKYEVTTACHVPVGTGFKYKKPGQVVTLKAAEARKLGDSVKKLDEDEGVAERNTPDAPAPVLETETVREVTHHAGESTSADERAGTEAEQ